MNNRIKRTPNFLIFYVVILCPYLSYAYSTFDTSSVLKQMPSPTLMNLDSEEDSLAFADKLMISKRSQYAINITTPLLEKLTKEGRYNSEFGFKVRLVHGSALIHASMKRDPFDFLWQLKDDSKAHKQWAIFAETCRIIASILEYSGREKYSLENLREAQNVINRYQLRDVYPGFAVRISSWHRNYGDLDSSFFYANEAIRTAPQFGKLFEEAEGNLLLGVYYKNQGDSGKAASHFKRGAELYRSVEEFTSFCSMHIGLARMSLDKKKVKEAFVYLDTAQYYLPPFSDNNIHQLHRILAYRGEGFQQLGMLDSALLYLNRAHSMQLEYLQEENLEKVVEIDNLYNIEKKTQELEIEKERKRRSLILAFLFLIFSGVLLYYYLKLRYANKLTLQQAEELKTLDIAKSRFFANVSHELRTPITLMLGPVRTVLKEGGLSEKQKNLLDLTNQGGEKLLQLVKEILDLRKLEMNKMVLNPEPTVLSIFFTRFALQFESIAKQKQIGFTVESELSDNFVGNIDQEKFHQILVNLLSNAFKFTPAGGEVNTNLSFDGQMVQLKVSDTGPGIPKDELSLVFDRYFQTNRPEMPAQGGTGIGLALCKEYAKLFRGQIVVESILGKGAAFIVTFPVELVSHMPPLEINPTIIPKTSNKPSIGQSPKQAGISTEEDQKPSLLIVEDNRELQVYLQLILQDNYQVYTAENGQEALSILSNGVSPQLILSDFMMPVMDGVQLLKKLKSESATSHIPVIMLTARAEHEDKLQALRIGVDDYLTKPFDEDELLVRIKNLLSNQRSRRTTTQEEEPSQETVKPVFSQVDLTWLKGFEVYIQNNYSDSSLSIPDLARNFAMSQSTLLRQLKRLTGLTPVKYIQEIRLDQARQLLENQSHSSIARVAYMVGYRDLRSFSRIFKKRYGKFPSEI